MAGNCYSRLPRGLVSSAALRAVGGGRIRPLEGFSTIDRIICGGKVLCCFNDTRGCKGFSVSVIGGEAEHFKVYAFGKIALKMENICNLQIL